MVLLIGPTTSGKTILSYQIKKTAPVPVQVISQDEVLRSVMRQDAGEISTYLRFSQRFIFSLREKIKSHQAFLIVLDMLNIRLFDVYRTILLIKGLGYFGKITLLKMDLPFELHSKFCAMPRDFITPISTEELFHNMVQQSLYYQSSHGSLKAKFPFTEEYIIEDPREVQFIYPEFREQLNSKEKVKRY